MASREELAAEDVANQYPGIPRITVRPQSVETPVADDPRMGGWRGQEDAFQQGIRATPWFSEFKAKHGEEPNLFDPNYDYRAAWGAGARPTVRDPGDNMLHWPSQFKGPEHPNRYVNGVDTITGRPPSAPGPAEGGPQPPWQGGRLFEPDLSPAPVKPQWQPGILSAMPIVRGIGSVVQGVRDAFNPADPAPRPAGGMPSAISGLRPRHAPPTAVPGSTPVTQGLGHVVRDVLQAPQNMFSDINVERHPASTPEQVGQARQQLVGSAAETAMNVAGPGLVNAAVRPGASAGVFGGRLSKAYNPLDEQLANLMESRGVPPQQIWKDTGMVKFADGKWAHEIPDIGASYKGDVDSIADRIFNRLYPDRVGGYGGDKNTLRSNIAYQEALLKIQGKQQLYLPDVIDHPELFKAYPELRKMPVSQDAFMHAQGVYYPETVAGKDIQQRNIKYREQNQPGKMARGATFDTLLHEIQHAIQQIEGMARGTSTDPWLARVIGTPANKYFLKEMERAPKIKGEDEFLKDNPQMNSLDYKTYLRVMTKRRMEFEENAQASAAGRAYPESAGENLSGLPGQRKNMTPEQLRGVFPPDQFRVPMEQQHVEFNQLTNPAGTVAAPFGPPPTPPSLLPGYKPQISPDFDQARMGGVLGLEGPQMSAPRPQPTAKFPQYAERYPEVGPPVQAVDPKTGKEYLAKQLTPEAEAFAKELRKIDKAMEKEGYTPYFDPAKREHVDPKHYPPNVDTTKIVPKKPTEKDAALISAVTGEEARARLRAAYQRGTEMPNTKDWYAMKQLEDEFIKELGPEAGRKAFQDKIATSMGATTGGADPTTNWRMAQFGNYLRQNNLPYPTAAHEMPYPIGGRFAGQNMALHKNVFDQGGFPALDKGYPKRHNFSQNFTGNRGAATMDEQMSSLMTPGTLMPPKGRYGYYENTLGEEAAKAGVQPQNYQDVAWSGAKNLKDPRYKSGQPFIQTINESIERTHRLTGMPREEIVRRGLIRSEIPMYGMASPVGLGSLVDPEGYNR